MKTILHNPLPQYRLVIRIGSRQIQYTQSGETLEQAKQYAAKCFDVPPHCVTQEFDHRIVNDVHLAAPFSHTR